MGFALTDLLFLSLKKEKLPDYSGLEGKEFPEKIPFKLVALCFFNSLLKLSIPLVLEETYSAMSGENIDTQKYILLVAVVILAIGLSQLVLIAYGLVLSLYRHHVKKVLSSRILANNFRDYRAYLEAPILNDSTEQKDMELWMKIGTRLSVYLHNYYESYLSLIFECFNIVVIVIYLIYKLSFSLVFGLVIAGIIMYKTIKTAAQMNNIRFSNIELRSKRLKILQTFFNRISEFKMCWLDKWIYDRVTSVEKQFQNGLRNIKLLDCWCVALWQFTSVGISSIVISAYYLFGFNESVDKDSVFTPSTFVYLLNMLNFPLNALSWYIAGIKTAQRAIEQLKEDIRLNKKAPETFTKIQVDEESICIRKTIQLEMHGEKQKDCKHIRIPQQELRKNKIYSLVGQYSEQIMKKLVFLFDEKCKKSYVEQNAWLAPSALDTFSMDEDIRLIPIQQQTLIGELMQLMECHDIPLNTNTQHYSGGQKLRISLVRALNLGQIIIINTDLNSLDQKMKLKVRGALRNLVDGCYKQINRKYTIFIKENVQISDFIVSATKNNIDCELNFKLNKDLVLQQEEIFTIDVFPEIKKYIENASLQRSCQYVKKQEQLDKLPKSKIEILEQQRKERKQKSIVTFDTFKIYYKSKKHIVFVISMIFVTLLSNYYNYYISTYIDLSEYNQHQVVVIVSLTIIFAFGLFFRSYYFADANLEESSRICNNLNKNILMDELSFYQSEEKVKQQSQTINSKSKLICALTSDTETIADHFPFSTNIFANNITVILSSMIVILIEVPQIMALMVLLIYYCNYLNQQSHKRDEHIKMAIKQKQVEVYKIISDIEGGRKYLIIHNKYEHFSKIYAKLRDEFIQIDWMSDKYRNYINLKYKSVMILFLVVAVALYSFVNVFTSQVNLIEVAGKTAKSSGLALLIQYTIQLSNYLLHFTMSIWEIKGQALSLQRVRPYLIQKQSIKNRIEAADKTIKKIRAAHSSEAKNHSIEDNQIIKIDSLDFAYESNPQTPIFKNLNLNIKKGDKFIIRGRSGSGKTTLYKLLTSAYPKIVNTTGLPHSISFSPQHPLLLPDTSTIEQNLNPYKISFNMPEITLYKQRYGLTGDSLKDLSYEQKIVLNNLRAYLYGYKGVIIYDEPQLVAYDRPDSTYLVVTHHHNFQNNGQFELVDGKLVLQ